MISYLIYIILISTLNFKFCCGLGILNPYPKVLQLPVPDGIGEPLILTPLIEAGKIKKARAASRVLPLYGDEGIESYSGFLTVNKLFNSNLFFWFFPSQSAPRAAPVALWLQGGPGASSLFGLFQEHGPFAVAGAGERLRPRKYAWTRGASVLYVDNPVGAGFSFTGASGGYARNETLVGRDVYAALLQFFQLFPELQKNAFFVTGESYAGKYVPAVGFTIHSMNPSASLKINLQGLAIGNGLSDPVHMLKYSDYLYQLGLIDSNARDAMHKQEDMGRKYVESKQWKKAYDTIEAILNVFHELTDFSYNYNYLHAQGEALGGDVGAYVQQAHVRGAIHVGNATFHAGDVVQRYLQEDFMQSVKPWVEELLEHYRVLVYNGQLDIIVAYPLTVSYLQTLRWSGAAEYRTASRSPWYVGEDIAGYVKTAGNLTEILVRNAGHLVPSDQPRWALDLIDRFTSNKPFHVPPRRSSRQR